MICQELRVFSSKPGRQGPWLYGVLGISEEMKFNKNKYEGFYVVPRKNKAKQARASPASNSTEAWWWICDLQAVPGKRFLGDIKLHTNQ